MSQYASHALQAKLAEYGMVCSMSRKGNCWDHAPTESWFNSFKNERVFGERFVTRDAMKANAFEYIEHQERPLRQAGSAGVGARLAVPAAARRAQLGEALAKISNTRSRSGGRV